MSPLEHARQILERCRTIAILGARDRPHQAGFYVPQYLFEQGYTVLPVNPGRVGQVLWGQPVVARLTDLEMPVDMVDVFRRSETLPGHLEEFLAMSPRPRVVWFQQGIRHDGVAAALAREGVEVVQDRCTLADHRQLGMSRLE
jgi:predicted CoA-binding protein